MDSNLVLAIDIVASLVTFSLVARWYVAPRLDRLSLGDALTPLLLFHTTRTIGLMVLVPAVVDPNLPRDFSVPAGYGDLLAVVLAFATIAAFRAGLGIAPVVAWVFSVEGIVDLLNANFQGLRVGLTNYQLGPAWFIPTVIVPALLVTHGMIVLRLIRHAREGTVRMSAARHPGSPVAEGPGPS